MASKISKVLIANRGEIAVRIAHTLTNLGLESVGVVHPDEGGSPASRAVDEVFVISGDTPMAAYLDSDGLLRAARETGADAVHPGYGFLAENASFARAVQKEGLLFIGPGPEVMELMGDKIAAREFVRQAGFSIADAVTQEEDPGNFLERACRIGFPLVLKPSLGGGGKGMHIVRSEKELPAAMELATSEAQRYFNDHRVFAERYIDRPRHIEVQVLADSYGHCLHLWERECSIQRRFQKVIEESPSPGLDHALRERICQEAVGIAKAANYRNAGTVEFILAPNGEFYFLEMNTRLQVEHPVTELVTGLDLVELQIRIAEDEPLSFDQKDIRQDGHAIECRLYAEDPGNEFLPVVGKVAAVHWPIGEGVRIDSGIDDGSEVTPDFDPMLAKLIVHGKDRSESILRSVQSLEELAILGLTTNTSFLARVLSHEAFKLGDIHTEFVAEYPDLLRAPILSPQVRQALLAAAALSSRDFCDRVDSVPEPYSSIGHWRN